MKSIALIAAACMALSGSAFARSHSAPVLIANNHANVIVVAGPGSTNAALLQQGNVNMGAPVTAVGRVNVNIIKSFDTINPVGGDS